MSHYTEKLEKNADRIQYCASMTFESYMELKEADNTRKNKKTSKADLKAKYNSNKNYLISTFKNGCKAERYYTNREGRGRVYCGESIQNVCGIIRSFIMDNISTDCDMINSHPSILEYLCKEYGIESYNFANLTYYNNNRTEMIKSFPDLKYQVIHYINASSSTPTIPFLVAFKRECKNLHKIFSTTPKFSEYMSKCESKNKIGTCMFKLMEDVEVQILNKVELFFKSKGIEVAIPLHDGLEIYGDHYSDSNLIKDVESVVEKHFPGLNAKFCYKPHKSPIKMPENFDPKHYPITDDGVMGDKDVALIIFETHKHKILKECGLLYACFQNKWSDDVEYVFKQWLSVCEVSIKPGCKLRNTFINSQTRKWPNYITQIRCICMDDNNLKPTNLLNRTKGVIPFMDGYYNLKTKVFKEYSDNNPVYFTSVVGRPFPKNVSEETKNYVEKKLLEIFNDDKELMKETFSYIARSFCNHYEDKLGLCMVGERDSSKGMIILLITMSFVGLVGNVISADFVHKKNSMESAERRNGFLKNFCMNPLCVSQEVSETQKLDGELWKRAISGGDTVTYRSAFGHIKEDDSVRSGYIITCNKTPTFTSIDCYKTMLLCNMPCQFMDVLPNDQFDRGYAVKLADPNIKNILSGDKYLDAFTMFVMNYYQENIPNYAFLKQASLENTQTTDEYVDPANGLSDTINNLYEFDFIDMDGSVIRCSEVHRAVKSLYPDASPSKIKTFLKNKGILVVKNSSDEYRGIKIKESKKEDDNSI